MRTTVARAGCADNDMPSPVRRGAGRARPKNLAPLQDSLILASKKHGLPGRNWQRRFTTG
jgi:hypothetical protein